MGSFLPHHHTDKYAVVISCFLARPPVEERRKYTRRSHASVPTNIANTFTEYTHSLAHSLCICCRTTSPTREIRRPLRLWECPESQGTGISCDTRRRSSRRAATRGPGHSCGKSARHGPFQHKPRKRNHRPRPLPCASPVGTVPPLLQVALPCAGESTRHLSRWTPLQSTRRSDCAACESNPSAPLYASTSWHLYAITRSAQSHRSRCVWERGSNASTRHTLHW